jgi:hypothetical protein
MTIEAGSVSRRMLARVAGWSLVGMALLAGFAVWATQAVVGADPSTAPTGIASHELLFRAGVCAWLLIAALDIVVAVALYFLFEPVNRWLSGLAGVLRASYAVVLVASISGLLGALRLVQAGASGSQVVLSLRSFADLWTVGLVLFGLSLALIGYLVWNSGFAPKIIGALLLLASAGYVLGDLGKILLPALGSGIDVSVALPEAVGELAFAVWLIVRAKRLPD